MRIILLSLICASTYAQILLPISGGSVVPVSHLRTDTFMANGTWTAPAGITAATIELWGAGGGGKATVGGGGGGAYSSCNLTVVPVTGYAIAIGTSAVDTNGGDTTFATTSCVAKGGLSGGNGGTGGASASGTGTTKYSGGNGQVTTGTAGGGGGAGNTGNGSAAAAGTRGAPGPQNGGVGGRGGSNGLLPSGGGGSGTSTTQSVGAQGMAMVSYSLPVEIGYPVVKTKAFGRTSGDTTSHVITLPSGVAVGDGLLVIFAIDDNPTLTITAGWTALRDEAGTSSAVHGAVFWKIASGSDDLTVTSSSAQNSTHVSLRIAGASQSPVVYAATASDSDPPSATIVNPGKYLFVAGRLSDYNPISATLPCSAPPTGYSDFLFVGTGATSATPDSTDICLATKHAAKSLSESENPGIFTAITEQNLNITIAIPGSVGYSAYVPLSSQIGYIASNGSTGPTYSSVRESAVYDAATDTTVVAWEGWTGSVRAAFVTTYDNATESFGAITNVGAPGLVDDDHGVPSIVKDHEGYWHVFCCSHNDASNNGQIQHSVTNSPNDLTVWTLQTELATDSGYPHPVMVGSTLYLFSRNGSSSGNQYELVLNKTTSLSGGVAAWDTEKDLINLSPGPPGTIARTYPGNAVVVGTEIWFIASEGASNDGYRRHVFFFRYDTADGSLKNYSGGVSTAAGSLPINRATADASYRIYEHQGSNEGTDIPTWFLDGSNRAHVFYSVGPNSGPFEIFYMYDTGSGWSTPEVITQTAGRYDTFAAIPVGDTIHLYYFMPWTGGGNDGQPCRKIRSAGGVWSDREILTISEKRIGRAIPVTNGQSVARVMLSERGAGSTDASAGGLKIFLYGDDGFIGR